MLGGDGQVELHALQRAAVPRDAGRLSRPLLLLATSLALVLILSAGLAFVQESPCQISFRRRGRLESCMAGAGAGAAAAALDLSQEDLRPRVQQTAEKHEFVEDQQDFQEFARVPSPRLKESDDGGNIVDGGCTDMRKQQVKATGGVRKGEQWSRSKVLASPSDPGRPSHIMREASTRTVTSLHALAAALRSTSLLPAHPDLTLSSGSSIAILVELQARGDLVACISGAAKERGPRRRTRKGRRGGGGGLEGHKFHRRLLVENIPHPVSR
eukprot:746560-Hanusia_phi.AAC.6